MLQHLPPAFMDYKKKKSLNRATSFLTRKKSFPQERNFVGCLCKMTSVLQATKCFHLLPGNPGDTRGGAEDNKAAK